MIIRVFRGQVQAGMQAAFERYIRDRALPEFRAHSGVTAVHFGTPSDATPDEFVVVTVWRNLRSLRNFAGDGWQEAVLAPRERQVLRRTFVHHYHDATPALVRQARSVRARAVPAPAVDGGRAQVLLVARHPVDVGAVFQALRARGLRALVVPGARPAARLLSRWEPRVAIVGARVPGFEELLANLEALEVPVILVGGDDELSVLNRMESLEDGVLVEADPAEIAAAARLLAGDAPPADLPQLIDLGSVQLDLAHRMVQVDGRSMELPPREFALLAELALHPQQPISSVELARRVWPEEAWTTGDDVRRAVYRLRRLIGDQERSRPMIRNRRGYGYVLEP